MQLRPSVQRFARWMEMRLRENDHKDGWDDMSPTHCHSAMCVGLLELSPLLQKYLSSPISENQLARKAIDIANYAMMFSERIKEIESHNGQEPTNAQH